MYTYFTFFTYNLNTWHYCRRLQRAFNGKGTSRPSSSGTTGDISAFFTNLTDLCRGNFTRSLLLVFCRWFSSPPLWTHSPLCSSYCWSNKSSNWTRPSWSCMTSCWRRNISRRILPFLPGSCSELALRCLLCWNEANPFYGYHTVFTRVLLSSLFLPPTKVPMVLIPSPSLRCSSYLKHACWCNTLWTQQTTFTLRWAGCLTTRGTTICFLNLFTLY